MSSSSGTRSSCFSSSSRNDASESDQDDGDEHDDVQPEVEPDLFEGCEFEADADDNDPLEDPGLGAADAPPELLAASGPPPVPHLAPPPPPLADGKPENTTVVLPGGGSIYYCKSSDLFEARCRLVKAHTSACRKTKRASASKVVDVNHNPHQGRPFIWLAWWIEQVAEGDRRDEHCYTLKPSVESRRRKREEYKALMRAGDEKFAAMFRAERKKRVDEGSEPDGEP